MLYNLWELHLQPLLKTSQHHVKFWKIFCVDQAPTPTSLHQVKQAPKHLLLISYEVEHQPNYVVESLDVANLVVVVCIGLQDVE